MMIINVPTYRSSKKKCVLAVATVVLKTTSKAKTGEGGALVVVIFPTNAQNLAYR